MNDVMMRERIYIKQWIKRHSRSPWLILMIVPVFLLLPLIVDSSSRNVFTIAELMNKFGYFNMFMGIIFSSYGGYCSFSLDEYDFSLFDKSKVLGLRLIAGIVITMFSILAVVSVMTVLSVLSGISLRLFLSFFLYAFLKFFTQIVTLFSIGFILGCVIKNRFLYVSTTAVFFLFSPIFDVVFSSDDSTRFLRNLLNLAYPNPNYIQFAAIGRLNTYFFSKSFFWIVVAAFFVFVLLVFNHAKPIRPVIASLFSGGCLLLTAMFVLCHQTYPDTISFTEFLDNQYINTNKINVYQQEGITLDYYITNMRMDLSLGTRLQNECIVTIHKSDDTQLIRLKIDEAFEVTAYQYQEGVKRERLPWIDQTRHGDYLFLHIDPLIYPQQELELLIDYHGHLNYQNTLYSKVFYSTSEATNLYHLFSWYPQIIENNNDIDFDVTIHANNQFVSNLADGKLIKQKHYTAQATKKQLYIISGYFHEVTVGDINCIIFEGYQNSPTAIENRVNLFMDIAREPDPMFPNDWESILERYYGGNYSQPYDAAKIRTMIFCPFYFIGVTLADQYEDTFFTFEAL